MIAGTPVLGPRPAPAAAAILATSDNVL